MSIGTRLKDARQRAGFTQFDAASRLNVTNVTLSRYETGGRLPSVDVLVEASRLYGVSIQWLAVGEQAEPERVAAPLRIPVLGAIEAGIPIERALTHHAEDHITIDAADLTHAGDILFALRVAGRSMVGAGIYPNDYAVCSLLQSFTVGDIVALYQSRTGESTIKQLGAWKQGARTMLLVPHNALEGLTPFRVDLSPDDQVRRVVGIVRRLRARA